MKYNLDDGFDDVFFDLDTSFAVQTDPLDTLLSDILSEDLIDIPSETADKMFRLIDLEVRYGDSTQSGPMFKIRTLYGTAEKIRNAVKSALDCTHDAFHLIAVLTFSSSANKADNVNISNVPQNSTIKNNIRRNSDLDHDEINQISELLNMVSEKVPTLLSNIMNTLYSGEAGKNMGRAVGNFYRELIDSGIPEQDAKEMAREYLFTLKSVTDAFKNN